MIFIKDLEEKLISLIRDNKQITSIFEVVRTLSLADWYIGAGLIRNFVWDALHGYAEMSPLNDVDVIYFDQDHLSWDFDEAFESELRAIDSRYNWSVKNQARMHIRNNHSPYRSIEDALREWPEVCTAVAVRLNADNSWTLIAPHGLEDLFSLVIRRSPCFTDRDYFLKRIETKGWTNQWSKLRIVEG